MMDFSPAPHRQQSESIVPMINVVFLLLVFFLMTSRLAPPEPVEVEPPISQQETQAEEAPVLYLSAEGTVAIDELRGEDAVTELARRAKGVEAAPMLRADAGAEAATVARVLKDLAAAGLSDVALVVAPE